MPDPLEPDPLDETQMAVCEECGYRAEMKSFLARDSEDTACPRCGADEVSYEM